MNRYQCCCSYSTGGMSPQALCRRRWLNQSTYSKVASSTSSRPLHGPRRRMSSVLNSPMRDSAAALRPLCQAALARARSVLTAARMMLKVSRAM
jgi:hypothetical protein